MAYDTHDTIAAIASAAGGAGRAVVRVSGPDAMACVASCFVPDEGERWPPAGAVPVRVGGAVQVDGDRVSGPLVAPGFLLIWPGERSYTRQPSAEFHTLGSPPVAAAVLEQLCRGGARPARPGEFTLRAFLAGRIDLTQAEAVLGVVEARDESELDGALEQLAGGLSQPLGRLREELLGVLAELEAGLDFADEHIEFIAPDMLRARLEEARTAVGDLQAKIAARDRRSELPRVVLTGPPNVGKSQLLNALAERFGGAAAGPAIVSATPGSTRDYVAVRLEMTGVECELIDVAGEADAEGALDRLSQQSSAAQRAQADLLLACVEAPRATADEIERVGRSLDRRGLVVITKADLAGSLSLDGEAAACSSVTGRGLNELVTRVRRLVESLDDERTGGAGYAAATAARCAASLREADRALAAAWELAGAGSDELTAAEVRAALAALGEVAGQAGAEDVLDRVFSQFCIGK